MPKFNLPAAALLLLAAAAVVVAQQPANPESAGQTLDRMLKPGPDGRPLPLNPVVAPPVDAATTRPGVAPGSPAQSVLREGSLVRDRTGRIVRSPDGSQVEFVFDADGTTLQDPPVVVLPNLKLMAMETAAANSTRDLRFRITGMVTEYRSRNYVLLDKVVVVPESAGRF